VHKEFDDEKANESNIKSLLITSLNMCKANVVDSYFVGARFEPRKIPVIIIEHVFPCFPSVVSQKCQYCPGLEQDNRTTGPQDDISEWKGRREKVGQVNS
jgi:hypothetical protein